MNKRKGRPFGSVSRNQIPRNEVLNFRCTKGLKDTIEAMIKTGKFRSNGDVIHYAVKHAAVMVLDRSDNNFDLIDKI